ncbi:MAG: hypothetical protein JWP60_2918 [Ramlibacter sp.]|nr:hypothetical protein [Ramlibacter sp.]
MTPKVLTAFGPAPQGGAGLLGSGPADVMAPKVLTAFGPAPRGGAGLLGSGPAEA